MTATMKLDGDKPMDRKTKRLKRGSRNKKKNMRKNIDLRDVDAQLQDERLEERLGGSMKSKKNEELFFMDTSADGAKSVLGRKAKARAKQPRYMSSFESLSKIAPVSKPPKRSIKQTASKVEKKVTQSKHVATTKKVAADNELMLWNDEGVIANTVKPLPQTSFLKEAEVLPVKHPGTPKLPEKVMIPAVEVPASGASYNPTYADHQKLLQEALEIEQKLTEEKEKVLKNLPKKLTDQEEFDSFMNELGSDIDQFLAPPSLKQVEKRKGSTKTTGFQVTKPKTQAQRKREDAEKEKDRLRKLEKQRRRAENEVFRIKNILKEIEQAEQKTEERKEKRREKEDLKIQKPRQLSRFKIPQQKPAIKLSEELTGSLRELKPEGSLARDRMNSLHRRNILEYRRPYMQKRKYKIKYYEKRQFKDFEHIQKMKQAIAKAQGH